MRHMELRLAAPGHTAATAYDRLRDFARYPDFTSAVRAIHVHPLGPNRVLSRWEVAFRTGILQWTEEDTFDPANHTIRFEQTEGDIDHFAGEWRVEDAPDGCHIYFEADFDLGIPGLGAVLEPLAERGLRDNIQAIVGGLLGTAARLASAA
jgi:ribosome-associated toxin RatA of RatAB toxin-antitoxin module